MRRFGTANAPVSAFLTVLLPVGLWTMLWLSIQSGAPGSISWGSPSVVIPGLRPWFPLIAAGTAMVIGGVKLAHGVPRGFGYFGPLGLATVYGVVGLIAALKSPDAGVSLWWGALYLSVPLVVGGVVWSGDPLDQLRRLINATWLAIILAAVCMFVIAALYVDLVDRLLDPTQFFRCQSAVGWFDLTHGILRETGVGRYAAIAGIVSISGLLQPKLRAMWGGIFLISIILLLSTGARGSLGGFTAGASLVLLAKLMYVGKRSLIVGFLVTVTLGSLFWSTGAPRAFLEACVFRSTLSHATPAAVTPRTVVDSVNAPDSLAKTTTPTSVDVRTAPKSSAKATPSTGVDAGTALDSPAASTPAREVDVGATSDPSAKATPSTGVDAGTALDSPAASAPARGVDVGATSDPSAKATPSTGFDAGTALDSPAASTPARGVDVGATSDPSAKATLPTGVDSESLPDPATTLTLKGPVSGVASKTPEDPLGATQTPLINHEFFTFTGRTAVWAEGFRLIKTSPLIGFGFHADRLLLGTHMHNSILHALLQAGFVGTIPFVGAVIFAWALFFRIVRMLPRIPSAHRLLVIQCGGVLAFLTIRSLPESTGAFFGIDWLILALVMMYLQVVNYGSRSPAWETKQKVENGA